MRPVRQCADFIGDADRVGTARHKGLHDARLFDFCLVLGVFALVKGRAVNGD
jgi:hypothetical protein